MPPAFLGTRIFLGTVAYLVMMQILAPLIDNCPAGGCLFPPISVSVGRPECAAPPTCNTSGCLSYEYAPCTR